jgi:hypothetical protein
MVRSAVTLLVVVLLGPRCATAAETGVIRAVADSLGSDMLYAGRTAIGDARDIATAPLHIGEIRNVTTHQLLIGALVVGSIGGTIALDQSIHVRTQDIGTHAGQLLETAGSTVSLGSVGALYLAGLATGNDSWRHGALTGVESFGLTSGLVSATQAGFGRQRPNAGKGAYTWFAGGTSFVSSATAPAFAAAESVSAAVDHDWRVTIPVYSAATAVGVGRLAQNAHWASDIVGAAWLAVGTAQALRHLHSEREQQETSSWSIGTLAGPNHPMGLEFNLRF